MGFIIKKISFNFLLILILFLLVNLQVWGGHGVKKLDKDVEKWDGYSWGKYLSDKFNYQFEYPGGGWKIQISSEYINQAKKFVKETVTLYSHEQDGAIITVDVWPNYINQTLDQWFLQKEKFLISDFAEIGRGLASKHNLESITYYEPRNPQTYGFHVTLFLHSNNIFRITYTEIDEGQSKEIYYYLISSFEFFE